MNSAAPIGVGWNDGLGFISQEEDMYCIAQDLFWFPAALRKPECGKTVLVSGGLAKWDGMNWYSMTGDDSGLRIQWEVKGWAEIPKIPKDFRNET